MTAADTDDTDDTDVPALSVAKLRAGDLVVSEMLNQDDAISPATTEWIELYNATTRRVDLDGLTVSIGAASFVVPSGTILGAHGFGVLVRQGAEPLGVSALATYPRTIRLDDRRFALALTVGELVIDQVRYDARQFFPPLGDAAMSLDAVSLDAEGNDDGQRWCSATSTLGGGGFGSPGAGNPTCDGMADEDGDRYLAAYDCDDQDANVHPEAAETPRDGADEDCDGADTLARDLRVGDLLLTEIMALPNVVNEDVGEWVEVRNLSGSTVNLRGVGIGDGVHPTVFIDAPIVAAVDARLVFAENGDPALNGGVSRVDFIYPPGSVPLPNIGGTVAVYSGTFELDSVRWNMTAFPHLPGTSMSLGAAVISSVRNNDGAHWCRATTHIGGLASQDWGSPGLPNLACP